MYTWWVWVESEWSYVFYLRIVSWRCRLEVPGCSGDQFASWGSHSLAVICESLTQVDLFGRNERQNMTCIWTWSCVIFLNNLLKLLNLFFKIFKEPWSQTLNLHCRFLSQTFKLMTSNIGCCGKHLFVPKQGVYIPAVPEQTKLTASFSGHFKWSLVCIFCMCCQEYFSLS